MSGTPLVAARLVVESVAPAGMDQAAWDELVTYLIHQRNYVDYGYIAAQAIVFYDYILTFDREINLVWFAPMSYTSVLFFLIKYLPIIGLSLYIPERFVIGTSMKSCAWQFPMATWILTIGILLADVVLVIRTWVFNSIIFHVGSVTELYSLGCLAP